MHLEHIMKVLYVYMLLNLCDGMFIFAVERLPRLKVNP